MSKTIQDAQAIIREHPIADLVTIDDGGSPAERAMFTPRVDDDFTVYFGTFASSNKIRHVKTNPAVIVVWPTGKGYLALTGKAELVDDQASRDHAWHPVFAEHFKSGSSDPNFSVIKVTPVSLSCYEEGYKEVETISLVW